MKILVTGAAGFIGKRLTEYLFTIPEVEFLIGIDDENTPPDFTNGPNQIWIQKNLNEVDTTWWQNVIEANNIDRIYWLESLENSNIFEPDSVFLNKLMLSEMNFCDYLKQRVNPIQLQVVFTSTDKVYKSDKFPSELADLLLTQSEKSDIFNRYALIKLMTETRILEADSDGVIDSRLLRPFALTGPDQNLEYPLPKMIKRIHDELPDDLDNGIPIFEDGTRGLVFTHVDDYVSFIISDNIFNQEIKNKLLSKIINFCRVWNYLSEIQLIEKIINKTESLVGPQPETTVDNFESIMATPQIRNMQLIGIPTIPIEIIIEEIFYEIDPQNSYAPLTINDISWSVDYIPTISGTAEPLATVSVRFGDGTSIAGDVDSLGNWSVTKDEFLTFDDTWYVSATTQHDTQYQTLKIVVPNPYPGS